jgi:hypothetical protein
VKENVKKAWLKGSVISSVRGSVTGSVTGSEKIIKLFEANNFFTSLELAEMILATTQTIENC